MNLLIRNQLVIRTRGFGMKTNSWQLYLIYLIYANFVSVSAKYYSHFIIFLTHCTFIFCTWKVPLFILRDPYSSYLVEYVKCPFVLTVFSRPDKTEEVFMHQDFKFCRTKKTENFFTFKYYWHFNRPFWSLFSLFLLQTKAVWIKLC